MAVVLYNAAQAQFSVSRTRSWVVGRFGWAMPLVGDPDSRVVLACSGIFFDIRVENLPPLGEILRDGAADFFDRIDRIARRKVPALPTGALFAAIIGRPEYAGRPAPPVISRGPRHGLVRALQPERAAEREGVRD